MAGLYPESPAAPSYAAPLLNFAPLGELGNDFFKGAENRRQYDLQRAFQSGLPTLPGTNIPDVGAMAQTIARLGGVDQAVSLANAAAGQQANVGASDFLATGGGAQPAASPASSAPAADYSARTARVESAGDATAKNTNSSASGQYQFTDGTWIQNFDKSFPQLADSMTPEQKLQVRDDPRFKGVQDKVFQTFTAGNETALRSSGIPINDTTRYAAHFFGAGDAAKVLKAPADTPLAGLIQPASLEANPFLQRMTAGQARQWLSQKMPATARSAPPSGPAPATGGAPASAAIPAHGVPDGSAAPASAQPAVAATAPAPAAPPGGLSGDPTLGGLVPPQWIARGGSPETYLSALLARAAQPNIAANAKEALLARAKAIQDTMTKWNEPTPELKLARATAQPGESLSETIARGAAEKKFAENEVERYGKRYDAIQETGQRALVDQTQTALAKSLMADPNFDSGVGAKYEGIYRNLLARFGGDPNAAVPQEAFRKIVSAQILDQIKGLAGTGPVRVAEMNIIKDASASQDNSPQSNRLLVEIASRLQQRSADIAAIAQNYKNGKLDAGFDRIVRSYDQGKLSPAAMEKWGLQRQGSLFTDDEIKDFRKIIGEKAPAQPKATETRSAQAPAGAVAALRSNPALRDQFDAKYGAGAAAKALGQ